MCIIHNVHTAQYVLYNCTLHISARPDSVVEHRSIRHLIWVKSDEKECMQLINDRQSAKETKSTELMWGLLSSQCVPSRAAVCTNFYAFNVNIYRNFFTFSLKAGKKCIFVRNRQKLILPAKGSSMGVYNPEQFFFPYI